MEACLSCTCHPVYSPASGLEARPDVGGWAWSEARAGTGPGSIGFSLQELRSKDAENLAAELGNVLGGRIPEDLQSRSK